jgi:predicted permease
MTRRLLRALGRLVSESDRTEWVSEWEAEVEEAARRGRSRIRILAWATEDAMRQLLDGVRQAGLFVEARHALRRVRRAPGYSLAVILTLALGIGANTAIFSVVDTYLVRPLALDEPDRTVLLNKQRQDRFGFTSAPNYLDWRERSTSFDALAAVQMWSTTLTGLDVPRRERLALVRPEFFDLLRQQPALGRGFTEAEGEPGAAAVAVLSHDLWLDAFGSDPGVLGTSITLDGVARTVVGVLPAGIEVPGFAARVYTPLVFEGDALEVRGRNNLYVVGRLADGISLDRAKAEMDGIGRQLASAYPEANEGWTVSVRPLHDALVADHANPLWILLAASGFVLLLACVNIASLVVARGMTREREFAVRFSLGAGRPRLLAQLVNETLLLSVLGGALGAALAALLIRPIRALVPPSLTSLADLAVDARVLAFALAASVLTGLLAGLLPALRLVRGTSGGAAGVGGLLRTRSGNARGSGLLVGSQFALATMLVFGAGLMARSLSALYSVDTGLRHEALSTFRVTLPPARYAEPASVIAGIDLVLEGLRAQSAGAAAVSHLPLSGANLRSSVILPGYFDLVGIPVTRGRVFSGDDALDSEPVAVINQRAAELFWPGEDPVGRWIAYAEDAQGDHIRRRIVGVVGNTLFAGPGEPAAPEVFQPHAQTTEVWRWFGRTMSFVVGTHDGSVIPLRSAQSVMALADPDLPVVGLAALTDMYDRSIRTPRFHGTLISLFAGLALILASVGLYGVTAFDVRRQWNELGVRKALGAGGGSIVRRVLGRSLGAALVGTITGLAGALLIGRAFEQMVFGVSVRDPAAIGGVVMVLLPVALLASWLPAARAARVDPVETLRSE